MTFATIKLFLPQGDVKRLCIGEVSNWTGKALVAPRTELDEDELLLRDELESSGVYFLLGVDAQTGKDLAYIGEAEVIRDRIKQNMAKDFWSSGVVFVSKDENLTKAHIRYLENRLLQEARLIVRYAVENSNSSNPKLAESDREDMQVYLSRIEQVLPVLGSDLLSPISGSVRPAHAQPLLFGRIKNANSRGRRTEAGFVVLAQSRAVLNIRPSADAQFANTVASRKRLIQEGTLIEKYGVYVFVKDVEFSSPSASAAVMHGGSANGLTAWKNDSAMTLKDLEDG